MSIPSYENYKESNEWFGLIPDSWRIVRIEHVTTKTATNISVKRFSGEDVFYYDIPSVQKTGKGRIEEGDNIDSNKFLIKGGEIIISKLNPRKGTVTLTEKYDGLTICSTEFVPLFPTNINGKLLYYMLSSDKIGDYLNSLVQSVTYSHQRIQPADITKLLIPFPSKLEQEQIACYLDDKLNKINQIVERKQKQIETLKQYRQSLITEKVSFGLNPNVEMKDSGFEDIGEIPKHWDIRRLGYLGRLQNGISKSSEYFGYGHPFVSYGDVYKNIELPSKVDGLVNSSRLDRLNYSVKKGDVFFTRTSESIEEIGFSSVCKSTINDAAFAGFLIRFRPNKSELTSDFSKYYFRSENHRKYFAKELNIVTRASLNQELLKKLPVLLPPIEEQLEIANFLDIRCAHLELLIKQTISVIEELKAYRQSLIYEAVTGKIDVRDYVVNEEEVTL